MCTCRHMYKLTQWTQVTITCLQAYIHRSFCYNWQDVIRINAMFAYHGQCRSLHFKFLFCLWISVWSLDRKGKGNYKCSWKAQFGLYNLTDRGLSWLLWLGKCWLGDEIAFIDCQNKTTSWSVVVSKFWVNFFMCFFCLNVCSF